MKFALISNVLPPSETAHAAIIYRLLKDLKPEEYCLLSANDYTRDGGPNYSARLPGPYYYLPPTYQITRGYRFGLAAIRKRVNVMLELVLRAKTIARILKSEKCESVVVCTGGQEILDFPAGYLASWLTGARFYPYLLDQYSHMLSYVVGRSFFRHFESRMLKGASAVLVPNEFLRDELRRRFNIEAVVIHNMCDLSAFQGPLNLASDISQANDNQIKIVYTGSIGSVHYDAFRNLIAAIDLLQNKDLTLHLYTRQPEEDMIPEGVQGANVVYHEHEPLSAMPDIQRRADILFLALSVNSPHPEIVRTAMPGKMGEYLASGRPILVHAPHDSFIAWYFRTYECGVVVDANDPRQLANAIKSILTDAALRERVGARARERARVDFDHLKEQKRFFEVLESGRSHSRDALTQL